MGSNTGGVILKEEGLRLEIYNTEYEIDIESIEINNNRDCTLCDLKYLNICKYTKCKEFNSHYKLKNKRIGK